MDNTTTPTPSEQHDDPMANAFAGLRTAASTHPPAAPAKARTQPSHNTSSETVVNLAERGSKRSKNTRAAKKEETSTHSVDAAVWLPTELKKELDHELGEEGLTISERVVEAFNNQHSNLPTMFPRANSTQGPMPTFRSTRRRRTNAGQTTLVRVRLQPDQKKVLDEAVASYNTNRSVLITKVLQADLSAETQSPRAEA